mgnify:CR=1 FL=1
MWDGLITYFCYSKYWLYYLLKRIRQFKMWFFLRGIHRVPFTFPQHSYLFKSKISFHLLQPSTAFPNFFKPPYLCLSEMGYCPFLSFSGFQFPYLYNWDKNIYSTDYWDNWNKLKGTVHANITSTVLYSFLYTGQRSTEILKRKQTGTKSKKLRDPKKL